MINPVTTEIMAREVCRYFLQGRCYYGARCRFSHQQPSQGDSRARDGREFGGYNPAQSNRGGVFDRLGYDRGGDRQQNRFDHFNSDSWRQTRGGGAGGRGQFGSYHRDNGHSRGPSSDRYEQRRLPSSDDYGRGRPPARGHGQYREHGRSRYDSSSGGYFSRERDGGYDGGSRGQVEPTSPEELAQVIREDMQIWSDSQMWPFSCYSFQKEGSCVPNLTDMSPEELRWKAYQAWADSAAQTVYQEELRRMLEQVMSVRRDLMSITAGRVQSLLSGKTGGAPSSLFGALSSSTSSPFSHTSPRPSLFQSPQPTTQTSIFASGDKRTALSSVATGNLFGGSLTGGSDGSFAQSSTKDGDKSSASEAPTTTTQNTHSTSPHGHTKDELDAFKCKHFALGKIPEKPPPPDLI